MRLRITGGVYRGRTLSSTRSDRLRPTTDRVRGAIFSIIGQGRVDGGRVLDLYAGTGALGIEALSRGAKWADFVESDARHARQIRENLRTLSLVDRSHVHQTRVERIVVTLTTTYDAVFIDPPYSMSDWGNLMTQLGQGGFVEENGVVIAEHRTGTLLAERYGKLVRESSRKYGDTSISIYLIGGIDG